MSDEFINICIIILILVACTYFYFNTNNNIIQEGLESRLSSLNNATINTTKTLTTSNNERDNTATYVENIKSQVAKMKAGLNIPTYRKDYEHALIQLDDYIGFAMLKTALNVNTNVEDPSSAIPALENLTKLNESKKTLNSLMTWIDDQK